MSRPPATYRVYCLDAARNNVSADWLRADDDEDAIAEAQARFYGSKCEVWQGKRLVASVGADLLRA